MYDGLGREKKIKPFQMGDGKRVTQQTSSSILVEESRCKCNHQSRGTGGNIDDFLAKS